LYVTYNMYIQEIGGIQSHLQAFSESGDCVLSAIGNEDKVPYVSGDLDKLNLMLFVAIVLDPRTKLNSLDFFIQISVRC
jgi:hypothetical protein